MPTATIIGSGPNGLSAAITLQQAGVQTTVLEASDTAGGGARTAQITLPGFHHDLGSSVYPLGAASPFFNRLPLARLGHSWIEPPAPLAHPLDDGTAVMLEHDLAATCAGLGNTSDAAAYRSVIKPLADDWPYLCREILGPILHLPRSPLLLARFGIYAMLPTATFARSAFQGARARALFAGMAAHSVRPLTSALSSAVSLVLATAGHTTGWPLAEGGAQSLTDAPRRTSRKPGWNGPPEHPRQSAGRRSTGGRRIHQRHSLRHLPASAFDHLRRPYARGIQATACPISIWTRNLQDRLGP